jgi:hypothetical protein
VVTLALLAGGLLVATGCARPAAKVVTRPPAPFAQAEQLLYPYETGKTVEGHRRLGVIIRSTASTEMMAAACYHYLRSSLDVAALTFYPIASADGRPEQLLPMARMVRSMTLDQVVSARCQGVMRVLPQASRWMGAWESLASLVETLSAGQSGNDPAGYHTALRQLARKQDWIGLRARFHLVGGCLASYIGTFAANTRPDSWSEFAQGCGYAVGEHLRPPEGQKNPTGSLAVIFASMARDLRTAIAREPRDPFAAFARHQLATVMAVQMRVLTQKREGETATNHVVPAPDDRPVQGSN